MSSRHVPRRPPTQPRSTKSWTRAQVADACGFADANAVYQLQAAHPIDPPCPCCGGFPRPFRAMGPGGYPRWMARGVEGWLERMAAAANCAESKREEAKVG